MTVAQRRKEKVTNTSYHMNHAIIRSNVYIANVQVIKHTVMVNKHISNNLKRAALRLKDRGHDSDNEICHITGISLSMLYCTWWRQLLTGDVAHAPAIGHSCPRKLTYIDCQYLIYLARHKPSANYRFRQQNPRTLPGWQRLQDPQAPNSQGTTDATDTTDAQQTHFVINCLSWY